MKEARTDIDAIPYAVVVRPLQEMTFNNWKWEAKIEEIGLLAYGNSKEDVFKSIMNKYKEWLSK